MKGPAQKFEDLLVWQRAHGLVLEVYRVSGSFPRNETFGMVSQLRRAMVSVPANIAAGFNRRGRPEKIRFFNIAQGSLEESHYYVILARDLDYLTGEIAKELLAKIDEIGRLLRGYIRGMLQNNAPS